MIANKRNIHQSSNELNELIDNRTAFNNEKTHTV